MSDATAGSPEPGSTPAPTTPEPPTPDPPTPKPPTPQPPTAAAPDPASRDAEPSARGQRGGPGWRRRGPFVGLLLILTLLLGMVLGGFSVTAGLVVGRVLGHHHHASHAGGWADRHDRPGPGPRPAPAPSRT